MSERFTEPWSTTALRTGGLALAIGIGVGLYRRQLALVPLATVLALWFTLGGHFAELFFRNHARSAINSSPAVLIVARVLYWFVAGLLLYVGVLGTRGILTGRWEIFWPAWMAGVLFVGIELVIHGLLRARNQPSAFDGRG